MSLPKQSTLKILIVGFCGTLAACGNQSLSQTNPVTNQKGTQSVPSNCQSFNIGDNLEAALGQKLEAITAPVARFSDSNQGRAVVLIPSLVDGIHLLLARKGEQGRWSISEKQTVAQIRTERLDASPMHRLFYNQQQQETVLFVVLPTKYLQAGIQVQPVLEETESRWGRLQPYQPRLTVQGFSHPFQGIERGLSGNPLPEGLTEIMNQIEAGSISTSWL